MLGWVLGQAFDGLDRRPGWLELWQVDIDQRDL
jgi:hypothetical protein